MQRTKVNMRVLEKLEVPASVRFGLIAMIDSIDEDETVRSVSVHAGKLILRTELRKITVQVEATEPR